MPLKPHSRVYPPFDLYSCSRRHSILWQRLSVSADRLVELHVTELTLTLELPALYFHSEDSGALSFIADWNVAARNPLTSKMYLGTRYVPV